MLDFAEVKKIRITDVVARYGIRLRFKGDWANTPCPLPTHKEGDKGRNFTINLPQNYWRCFSESCNANNNGRKGGDVINFVALMENCRERDAAAKLVEWFNLDGNKKPPQPEHKTGPHMESRDAAGEVVSTQTNPTSAIRSSDITSPAVAGKPRYMQEIDEWFNELFGLTPEKAGEEYWKKARNAVKSKLIESYKSGKLSRAS